MPATPLRRPLCAPTSSEQTSCRISMETRPGIEKEDLMETYFRRLIWVSKLHGMYFCPTTSRWVWTCNIAVNVLVIVIVSCVIVFEVKIVTADGMAMDMETSTMLCGIVWMAQAVISMVFLIWWQAHGEIWIYLRNVVSTQKGECITKGKRLLNRTLFVFRAINVFIITMVIGYHYGPEVLRTDMSKYEFFTNPWLKPLHSFSILHLFMCWNMAIFLFNILIDGAYLMVKHFNCNLSKIQDKGEAHIKNELVRLIGEHSRITGAVHELDKLFKIYAFTMISTIIPSTLLTIIMLAHRVDGIGDVFILGLPLVALTLYGFLGLTLSPARLYEEMYSSKNVLCQNTLIWQPYRPEVYQLAMALSSHLDQPNMGLSIWGFAMLSKSLILATFSGMIMVLSLILEFVPTMKDIVIDSERNASST